MNAANKEYLLFDLDGTLTDPKIGITRSVQYSLRAFGINVGNADDLVAFIGPPLRESYKKFYAFSDTEAERAVEEYRKYFAGQGIFENSLYDGVEHLLAVLAQNGRKLMVATSKPTVYAEKILEHFRIDKYFSFVAGSELDGTRSDKAMVIRHALDNMGISEIDRALMTGDREYDIIGAKKLGMESVGVLYGYGGREELSGAGADHIAEDVPSLLRLLASNA